jgi:hypothetical protein
MKRKIVIPLILQRSRANHHIRNASVDFNLNAIIKKVTLHGAI